MHICCCAYLCSCAEIRSSCQMCPSVSLPHSFWPRIRVSLNVDLINVSSGCQQARWILQSLSGFPLPSSQDWDCRWTSAPCCSFSGVVGIHPSIHANTASSSPITLCLQPIRNVWFQKFLFVIWVLWFAIWNIGWLEQLSSFTGNLRCCKFSSGAVLSHPENTIFPKPYQKTGFYSLSASTSSLSPEPWCAVDNLF